MPCLMRLNSQDKFHPESWLFDSYFSIQITMLTVAEIESTGEPHKNNIESVHIFHISFLLVVNISIGQERSHLMGMTCN